MKRLNQLSQAGSSYPHCSSILIALSIIIVSVANVIDLNYSQY